MGNQPLVSIVIPHYDERELLRECLKAFEEREYEPIELIVVDNGSTDGSREMVRNEFPNVQLLECPPEAGLGAVNNIGLAAATGEILVFDFNNDEVIEPGWIATLVDVLNSNPEVSIVSGLRLRYDDRTTIDSAGTVYDVLGRQRNYQGKAIEKLESGQLRFVDFVEVPMFRKELFEEVGPLDEEYEFYCEEADFCLRAGRLGHKVAVCPDAVTFHRRGASTGMTPTTRFYSRRNRLRMYLKTYPLPRAVLAGFWWAVVVTMWETIILLFRSGRYAIDDSSGRFDKNLKSLWAVYLAVWWNIKNLKDTIRSRGAGQ